MALTASADPADNSDTGGPPYGWTVEGHRGRYETSAEAVARAWELTPAGGQRPAVMACLVPEAAGFRAEDSARLRFDLARQAFRHPTERGVDARLADHELRRDDPVVALALTGSERFL